MSKALRAQLAQLEGSVQTANISAELKRRTVWCVGQLPALYDEKLHQTYESKYGGEITRLVRAMLRELADSEGACPESRALATSIIEYLRLLHERFGIGQLDLTPAGASPT